MVHLQFLPPSDWAAMADLHFRLAVGVRKDTVLCSREWREAQTSEAASDPRGSAPENTEC